MSCQMEHDGTRSSRYCLYVPFSDPILMLSTYPTEWKLLLLLLAMLLEFSSSKKSIIQMVCLDPEPFIPCHWFEALGTLYCFASIIWILWKIKYLATCVVHKQAVTCVSNVFFTKCMREATGNRREILVSGNTKARSKIIRFECVRFRRRTRHNIWWRSCSSLSKEACHTFHIRNITGRSTTLCDNKASQVKCGIGITSVGKPFLILHQCLDPICRGMRQSLVSQENFLLRGRKVGILLMEDRLDVNTFIVCLNGVTKSIRPKTIPSTCWKGKGNHGKVSARAVVLRKNYSIV